MSGVRWPQIVEVDANTWGLVYIEDAATRVVSYATAPKSDPHTWTKQAGDNPILSAASGDIRGVAVILDGSTYQVLYDIVGAICYASGAALNSLTKHSATDVPVFEGTGGNWDWETYVRHPTLIKVGSTYHMFYDGRQTTNVGTNGGIGHATSSDLITWVRDTTNNPILLPIGDSWESNDLTRPYIALYNSKYYLFYSGYDGSGGVTPHKIGYAVSDSLSPPSFKRNTGNPVIDLGGASEWDEDLVDGACLFQESGNVHLYFEGRASNVSAIGYATI